MKYCPKCRTRYPGEGACPRDQTPLEPDPLLGWVVARRRLDAVLGEGAQAVTLKLRTPKEASQIATSGLATDAEDD
jgi:hypothetical protein